MKIEMNGKTFSGNYVDIISQMKSEELVDKDITTMEYANDLEYLMLRFFDKDVSSDTVYAEDKCEQLVKELLRKGIAKRID